MTCTNCENVSTVKMMVCQFSLPASIAQTIDRIESPPIKRPTQSICCHIPWAKILSSGGRGGRCIIPRSTGSADNANPGKPSVTRLIQRIWIGRSGIGKPKNGAKNSVHISPELLVMVYFINLRILSNTRRPSRIAATIVAKLSSIKTISEASRATSVPFFPIAIPILAAFNAGASLTPSPVIATNCPLSCRA